MEILFKYNCLLKGYEDEKILVEMVAPSGYQRKNGPIPVTVNQESSEDGNYLSMKTYSDYSNPAIGGLKLFLYFTLLGAAVFIVISFVKLKNRTTE